MGTLTVPEVLFEGLVELESASVRDAFMWRGIQHAEKTRLVLINTSVGALADDVKSWPQTGQLSLDGFKYERFTGAAVPKGSKVRLAWLSRQDTFSLQPYRQLAKVLGAEGDQSGALQTLWEMEHQRRKREDTTHARRLLSWILRETVGYGYFPFRAFRWLALLILAGTLLYWAGFYTGNIVPTEKDAYTLFEKDPYSLPANYSRFQALIYSVENSFPLVKLGQVDLWQPKPAGHETATQSSTRISSLQRHFSFALFLKWFRWIQILLGWVLATLFVAGVTGLVRRVAQP